MAFVETCARDGNELKYSWIDYLPTKPMESLWKPLYQSIASRLQNLPIIQTWEGKYFRHPREVRLLETAHYTMGGQSSRIYHRKSCTYPQDMIPNITKRFVTWVSRT